MNGTGGLDLVGSVDRILSRRPAVGLAVGVVRDGAPTVVECRGVADVASMAPVTEDTVFRVASITKTFTAIAVMQLWEQGRVDLDAPANDYLRGYRLTPAKASFRPATIRHLLTHTAGVPEGVSAVGVFRPDFGESVLAGQRVPSLAEFYHGSLRVGADPGTRFRYTNHGPATLGQIVADVSGLTLAGYLAEHVFGPLGMADTTMLRAEVDPARLATGYTLSAAGPKAVPLRDMVTAGAASAYSTPRDMAGYLAALLGGGANADGRVLDPATVADMFAAQYRPDPRVPGLGLAFFRATAGGHALVEHQGILPGFDSQLVAAPDDGVGVIAFTNGTRLGMLWLPTETSRLLNQLLGVPDDVVRTDIPAHPETWEELCGWYHLPGPLADARVRGMARPRRRSPGPPRATHAPVPDPRSAAVPGVRAAPRRRHRPRLCSGSTCPNTGSARSGSCSAATRRMGPRPCTWM